MAKNMHETINKLKKILKGFEDAEARAKELQSIIPPAPIFVGICGIQTEIKSFELADGFIKFRKVLNPPGMIHVARSANLNHVDYMGVSRYSTKIGAEIAIGLPDFQCEKDFLLGVAWHIAALLKLKSSHTLFCPVAATVPWDTVCAVSDNSVSFYILDDIPKQIMPNHKREPITHETVKWVNSHLMNAYELRNRNNSRRFGLAFNNMYTWNHTTDSRIALANIWIGLEALFGKREDKSTTEGLARRISDWLPSRRDIDVYELYNQRCDAVHGRYLDDEEIVFAINKSEILLKLSIIKCIETSEKTLPDWTC